MRICSVWCSCWCSTKARTCKWSKIPRQSQEYQHTHSLYRSLLYKTYGFSGLHLLVTLDFRLLFSGSFSIDVDKRFSGSFMVTLIEMVLRNKVVHTESSLTSCTNLFLSCNWITIERHRSGSRRHNLYYYE